jgi:hypothetical protein
MAFTYVLSTGVGKIRMRLPDKTENSGSFPDDANFSDEELTQILSDEGGEVMRAVAACCEILAGAWATVPSLKVGSRDESSSDVAKAFAARALALRDQYGGGASGVSVALQRVDGFAVNAGSADEA